MTNASHILTYPIISILLFIFENDVVGSFVFFHQS